MSCNFLWAEYMSIWIFILPSVSKALLRKGQPRKWQDNDDGTMRVYSWRCEDSRLNHGYQSPLYLLRFILYRKLCIKHRHHWVAYSFHMWGVPGIWCSSTRLQANNHCKCFRMHVKTVLSFVGIHAIIVIFGPSWPLNITIAMAPVLSWKVSSCTSTLGVCQDSRRNPLAGKLRICQNNGSGYSSCK